MEQINFCLIFAIRPFNLNASVRINGTDIIRDMEGSGIIKSTVLFSKDKR